MKNRGVLFLYLFLFLFLFSSCGIPTWFNIESSNARLSNSSTNYTTTITVNTEFNVDVKFFLLYTIHNGTSSSTPSSSSIQSGLTSAFRNRYRTGTVNSNRFSNNRNPVADYTYTSSSTTFNLYPVQAVSSSDGSPLPLNGVGSGMDYLFYLNNDDGAVINATVTYNLTQDPSNSEQYILTATLDSSQSQSSQNGITYELARFNNRAFLHSSGYTNDNANDHQSVESGSYSLYLYPVMYISATRDTSHNFSNTMLVTPSSFLTLSLTGGSVSP